MPKQKGGEGKTSKRGKKRMDPTRGWGSNETERTRTRRQWNNYFKKGGTAGLPRSAKKRRNGGDEDRYRDVMSKKARPLPSSKTWRRELPGLIGNRNGGMRKRSISRKKDWTKGIVLSPLRQKK